MPEQRDDPTKVPAHTPCACGHPASFHTRTQRDGPPTGTFCRAGLYSSGVGKEGDIDDCQWFTLPSDREPERYVTLFDE